jgi:hypothetical protein
MKRMAIFWFVESRFRSPRKSSNWTLLIALAGMQRLLIGNSIFRAWHAARASNP